MLLEKLVGVQLNARQIERVSHYYGERLEEASLNQAQDDAGWLEEQVHYGWGPPRRGMVLTRADAARKKVRKSLNRRVVMLGSR